MNRERLYLWPATDGDAVIGWSWDRVGPTDIEYIRADLLEAALSDTRQLYETIRSLTVERQRLRRENERLTEERDAAQAGAREKDAVLMRLVDLANSGHGLARTYELAHDIAADARRVLRLEREAEQPTEPAQREGS